METFTQEYSGTQVSASPRLCWAGQAGFLIEAGGLRIGVDLYLSNCCERYFGFKRLFPAPFSPLGLGLDIVVATHEHYDHFDVDAMPFLMDCEDTVLVTSPGGGEEARRLGLPPERVVVLHRGENQNVKGASFTATWCDHGKLAPDAVGMVVRLGGKSMYFMGDTAFHQEPFAAHAKEGYHFAALPINGAFGNLDAAQAARAAALVKAELTVPCHYWMFAEHSGDPGAFMEEMKALNQAAALMAPGRWLRL